MNSFDREMALQAAQEAAQAIVPVTPVPRLPPVAPATLPIFPSMDAAAAAAAGASSTVRVAHLEPNNTPRQEAKTPSASAMPKPRVQGRRRVLEDVEMSDEKVAKLQRRMVCGVPVLARSAAIRSPRCSATQPRRCSQEQAKETGPHRVSGGPGARAGGSGGLVAAATGSGGSAMDERHASIASSAYAALTKVVQYQWLHHAAAVWATKESNARCVQAAYVLTASAHWVGSVGCAW